VSTSESLNLVVVGRVCGRISAVSIPLVEIRRQMKIGFLFMI
jgi:hypothetical protein